MTYLQRALTGNAKKAIGGMLNHGHLYKAALTELEEQFGNEELVAGAFMKAVFDHPVVVEGDIAQLRSFYNTLHNAVATMKSLGYSHDLMSSTNTRVVLQKLPDPLKETWGERKIEMQPAIPSLVDLGVWLRVRLRAKTTVCEPLPSFSKPSRGGKSRIRRPPRKGEQHRATTFGATRKLFCSTFVANRVSEIHYTTYPTQWRHVPGHWNPADDCTRGLRAADLSKRLLVQIRRTLAPRYFYWSSP